MRHAQRGARILAVSALIAAASFVIHADGTPSPIAAEIQLQLAQLFYDQGGYADALRAYQLALEKADSTQVRRARVGVIQMALRTAEFDVARLESRAAVGGTTLTELADHLVRQHDISFRVAHSIAGHLLQAQREHPEAPLGAMLAAVSSDVLGAPLEYTDAQIAEIMSPRHFVEVRRTHGGPAPDETARALADAAAALEGDRRWVARVGDAVSAADERLEARSRAL